MDVEGWFCVAKEYPSLERLFLNPDVFKLSTRELETRDMAILPMKRLVGGLFNAVEVTGVVDKKGSLTPFFITNQKAEKLRAIQSASGGRLTL